MADVPELPDLRQYEEYLAVRIRTFEAKKALDDLVQTYQEPVQVEPELVVLTLREDLRGLANKLIPDPEEL